MNWRYFWATSLSKLALFHHSLGNLLRWHSFLGCWMLLMAATRCFPKKGAHLEKSPPEPWTFWNPSRNLNRILVHGRCKIQRIFEGKLRRKKGRECTKKMRNNSSEINTPSKTNIYGCFQKIPKIGVPPNHPLRYRVFHYKPSILGVKYPYTHMTLGWLELSPASGGTFWVGPGDFSGTMFSPLDR